ncbi:MAG: cyclic nucleotide-binding domain-containing protein [Magnetococcales bacterium]|nr:cyclic nucleotide-binding domain-containing protein [Magnetococcales bacterium]
MGVLSGWFNGPMRHLGVRYEDGEYIFRQGDTGETIYSVQEGHVEILAAREGCQEMVLAVLGPGELFGLTVLTGDFVRTVTARAKGNARVLSVDRLTLVRQMHTDPALTFRILAQSLERLRELTRSLPCPGTTLAGEKEIALSLP